MNTTNNFVTTTGSDLFLPLSLPSATHFELEGKKSNPITGLDRLRGFQEVEAPRFQDIRHMKVVRLSAVRTGFLYFTPHIN